MHARRRRNHFSLAATLEPLQSVDAPTELSLDGSFIAKNLVERIAIRDYVLRGCDLLDAGPSPLRELFHKIYSGSYHIRSENRETLCGTELPQHS
jgi:hypothetical protein